MAGPQRRLPLEPLADVLGVELGRMGGYQPDRPAEGLAAIAERLGVSFQMAQKLRRYGLSAVQADRYACRVGRHPSAVWPEWWALGEPGELDAVDRIDDICAFDDADDVGADPRVGDLDHAAGLDLGTVEF